MNSNTNNTATATASADGWQPFMNRKARRAALRRARNRTLTRQIEEEKAAVWAAAKKSRKAY